MGDAFSCIRARSLNNSSMEERRDMDDALRPSRLDEVLDAPVADRGVQERHSWHPMDCSQNMEIKPDDPLTFHRHPVAQSTDAIRGKIGFEHGFHVWQIDWPTTQRGTHAIIGVGTRLAPLHATGYCCLVGSNSESWGWDLVRNEFHHDTKPNTRGRRYPTSLPRSGTLAEGGQSAVFQVYCILDMDEGYLAFATETRFLGVACRGLRGRCLYPMVSAVWGHCEVKMLYIGGLAPEPRPLLELCRRAVRQRLGKKGLRRVNRMPLPLDLQNYLLYK